MLMETLLDVSPNNQKEKEEILAALAYAEFKYGLYYFYHNRYTDS